MADHSAIEWTDATWNFLAGCSPVSEGCRNCYAAKDAVRLGGNPNEKVHAKYGGTAEMRGAGERRRAVFTGKVTFSEEALLKPLSWRRGRKIFVNSMSDLFHADVADEVIDRAFAVMALAQQHTFQVLTKRPERMAEYFADEYRWAYIEGAAQKIHHDRTGEDPSMWLAVHGPLPNVWLGASVENQDAADERIPHLLRVPAAVRFLSLEPLLGPVELSNITGWSTAAMRHWAGRPILGAHGIGWGIVGGESGPNARPMHPAWARSLRDQFAAADVPFFFKQWGEWVPAGQVPGSAGTLRPLRPHPFDGLLMYRAGKAPAGRLLDGVEHNAFPEVVHG